MLRRAIIVLATAAGLALSAAITLAALPAWAGGGCGSAATQGSGGTIRIANACFTPSVLHVEPGTKVTWVNEDPFVHNIGGNLWGHFGDLRPGQTFAAAFPEPGIYPFACSYHPGMTGAIVVGDGTGVGSGQTVSVQPYGATRAPSAQTSTRADASVAPTGASGSAGWGIGLALGGLAGVGLGAAAMGVLARRRRPE